MTSAPISQRLAAAREDLATIQALRARIDALRIELATVKAERRRNYKTHARRIAAAIIALEETS